MPDFTDELPIGIQPLYRALGDAGITTRPQRNVPWVNQADDETWVLNVWRDLLKERDGGIVAVVDARSWRTETTTRQNKRQAVVDVLADHDGRTIGVVVIERVPGSSRTAGARFDDGGPWLVEDTGTDFVLWRGRDAVESEPAIPPSPADFGNLTPERREIVSTRIERDARVRRVTLQRARDRCEVVDCRDHGDFANMDVHHITSLGNGGSDHTYNTIALCPACHVRVHRGTQGIQAKLELSIKVIRDGRPSPIVPAGEGVVLLQAVGRRQQEGRMSGIAGPHRG
jgi:hypothetical protein